MMQAENLGANGAKPSWVDIATFVVLLLTLAAVALYTREAIVAIRLTRQALELDFRPYIRPLPYDRSIDIFIGRPVQIDVLFLNQGRRPARVSSRGSVTYSQSHLDNGSSKFVGLPAKFVWPGSGADKQSHVVISSDTVVDDKVRDDMNEGHGWLYVNVQVEYEQYMTRICYEYPFVTHALVLGTPRLCSDAASNCVDEGCK
jgi:hypothetical protein